MLVPIFRRQGKTNKQTNKSKVGTRTEREVKGKKFFYQ